MIGLLALALAVQTTQTPVSSPAPYHVIRRIPLNLSSTGTAPMWTLYIGNCCAHFNRTATFQWRLSVSIRKATSADACGILACLSAAFEVYRDIFLPRLRAARENGEIPGLLF